MLDDYDDEELFPDGMPKFGEQAQQQQGGGDPMAAMMAQMGGGGAPEGGAPQGQPEGQTEDAQEGQKMPEEEQEDAEEISDEGKIKVSSVGVVVVKNGKILCGTRLEDGEHNGTICGAGGHIEKGETPRQAAYRETEEEFGISPKDLTFIGVGDKEKNGLRPAIYLCTEFNGEPECMDGEMADPKFRSLEELEDLDYLLFKPFKVGYEKVIEAISKSNVDSEYDSDIINMDLTIPKEDAEFFTDENGKVYCRNKKTGEISGLGPEIEEETQKGSGGNKSEPNLKKIEPKNKMFFDYNPSESIDGFGRQKGIKVSPLGKNSNFKGFSNTKVKGKDVTYKEEHYNKHIVERQEPPFMVEENGGKRPMTIDEYNDFAENMLRSEVGGDIEGFAFWDKAGKDEYMCIVRYNTKTGVLAMGFPNIRIKTCGVFSYFDTNNKYDPNYLEKGRNYLMNMYEGLKEEGDLVE